MTRRFAAQKGLDTLLPYRTRLARLSAKARSLDAAAAKKRRKYSVLRPKAHEDCDHDHESDPDHSNSDSDGNSSHGSTSSSSTDSEDSD